MLFKYSHLQISYRYKLTFSLCGWFIGNRLRSVEILTKSSAIRIEQFDETLWFRRAQDEPGVMMLGHAIHDLRIVVSRSIRRFLPRQRDNHASVPVASLRQLIRFFPRSNFQASPFSPQINSRGSFNLVRDVRSADTRGHFDKIKFAVTVRAQEFRVRHAASETQCRDHLAIDFQQRLRQRGSARQRAAHEYSAAVRHIKWRTPVRVRLGEYHLSFRDDAVHVKYISGHELLEQVKRLLIAQLGEPRPELAFVADFLHADSRGLRARFQKPWRFDASHEISQVVIVQHMHKFGHGDAFFPRAAAHGQLVAEIAHRRQAHPRNAEVLSQRCHVFHVEFIERNDAVNRARARHVAHRIDQTLQGQLFRNIKRFGDCLARPVRIAKLLHRQEKHVPPFALARAHELLPLFIGTDAKNCRRTFFWHKTPQTFRGESQLCNASRKNELYVGLSRREEKSQKWIHAQGPGRFVVLAALNFAITQVVAFLPAATD